VANFAIPSGSSTGGTGGGGAGREPGRDDGPGYDQRYAPVRPSSERRGGEGAAVASLVLGILSVLGFCLWFFAAPTALVGLALGAKGREGSARGLATAGMILSGIGLAISVITGALYLFFLAGAGSCFSSGST
jgi:hypothetical protein